MTESTARRAQIPNTRRSRIIAKAKIERSPGGAFPKYIASTSPYCPRCRPGGEESRFGEMPPVVYNPVMEPKGDPVCPSEALKAAEEALRRNQRLFTAFMDNLPGVAFIKSHDGRYLHVNRQFAVFFESTPEKILGKTPFEMLPEDLARQMQKDDEEVLAKNRPAEFLHTIPGPRGAQRWLSVRFPIEQGPGEPPVLGGVALDVTKYKNAEDALRQSEEKYRVLVESADEAIFTMDAEGRYVFANTTAATRLGRTPDQLVGKTAWDIFPKEIADEQVENVRNVIASGRGDVFEAPTLILGQEKWYRTSIHPVRDQAGNVTMALVIARNISDQKAMELALARSEERFRLTFENAIDPILWADPETGRYINCNKAAEKLLGWSREQIIGRHFTDIHPPEEREKHTLSIAESAQGPGFSQIYGHVVTRDGEVIPVHIAASKISIGSVPIIQGTFRDRRAEAALEAARLKVIRVREEEQKRMARELHDSIGQQLVAMKMSLSAAGLTEDARRCVEMIQEVRHLCYDLYPPSLEALGLASALHQIGRHCGGGARFTLDCEPELEKARFDAEKEIALFRVAQEAVSNAIRHGRAGAIRVRLARRDGQIEMTVADDGQGFDADGEGGKGLGLRSMTDRIEAVNGTIEFRSGAEGTSVSVRVPLSSSR